MHIPGYLVLGAERGESHHSILIRLQIWMADHRQILVTGKDSGDNRNIHGWVFNAQPATFRKTFFDERRNPHRFSNTAKTSSGLEKMPHRYIAFELPIHFAACNHSLTLLDANRCHWRWRASLARVDWPHASVV